MKGISADLLIPSHSADSIICTNFLFRPLNTTIWASLLNINKDLTNRVECSKNICREKNFLKGAPDPAFKQLLWLHKTNAIMMESIFGWTATALWANRLSSWVLITKVTTKRIGINFNPHFLPQVNCSLHISWPAWAAEAVSCIAAN